MSTSTQKRVARIYRLGADAHHHRHERGYMARLAQDNDISGGTLSKARAIVEAASRISRNADDVTLLRIHWEDTCGEERGGARSRRRTRSRQSVPVDGRLRLVRERLPRHEGQPLEQAEEREAQVTPYRTCKNNHEITRWASGWRSWPAGAT
jgi:hypothetical protein